VLLVEILLEVRHGGRIPVSDRLKTSTTPLAPRFTSASSVCAHRGASQGWLRFAISRREIARSRDSGRNASLRMGSSKGRVCGYTIRGDSFAVTPAPKLAHPGLPYCPPLPVPHGAPLTGSARKPISHRMDRFRWL
jgi:hypothetical protein